ncbi:carboxylesterase/lipase family protein [Nocardia goodfellowii]|uniref:Carboxylic ester hydrolase n=1 Tax=Nocardia goodfellowii TaxID=882446 RepID=A0ABS4QJH9_9NOCA|nr:carboxylesterase family protein [Nocardia goodfellowii]MBP2191864.1 para-nitrobenzyl esterase [Nocardia goodfellowii]
MTHFRARCAELSRCAAAVIAAIVLSLSASHYLPVAQAEPAGALVTVTGGTVRGFESDGITKFHGIPYAASTAGAGRFAPPRPVEPWAGIRDANRHGPQCPQASPMAGLPALQESSEDCLSIDLYVPPAAAGERLPVMVWIYGGGFLLGSNAQYDSPSRLVREGRVIVAIPNYRVGPFGFLALPELAASHGATGTYGILDQQAALRWIQDNAAAFGGDPGNVTLMGESAGGMSVCTQIASPGARGLYAKAIVQSGACARSPLVPPSLEQAYQRARDYSADMGCADAATRLQCLRDLPVERLLNSPTTRLASMTAGWTPVLDGVVVTRNPEDAFAAGAARDLPMIVGSNAEEGATFLLLTDFAQGRIPDSDDYVSWVRHFFDADAERVLARYPETGFGSAALAKQAVITDGFFACPALFTTAAAQAGGATVWQYRFTDSLLPPNPVITGAFHAADVLYLFSSVQGMPVPLPPQAAGLAHRMQDTWAHFAYTGRPDSAAFENWRPWRPEDPGAITLDRTGSPIGHDFAAIHRCDLWSGIARIG